MRPGSIPSKKPPRVLRPFLVLLPLALMGCASGRGSDPFTEAANMDVYLLRVESRNLYEVSVYANPGGRRQLVGTIPGNGLEFLEFEYPAGRPLNVELETRLGDRFRMPGLTFPGGGRLDLIIQSDLRRSAFVRRPPGP